MTENQQQLAKNLAVRTALENADLIRSNLKGSEDILKTLRALFFGLETTEAERGAVTAMFKGKEELQIAIRKKFYGKLSKQAPIGNNPDIWAGTEQQIQGQHPDTIKQILSAKQKNFAMLDDAMKLLEDVDAVKIESVVEYEPNFDKDPLGIELLTRNLYIQTIENGLSFIKIAIDLSEEDAKKIAENQKRDSTK